MQENWQTIRQLLRYYPRVLKLVWSASPRAAFFTMLFSIINALAFPAQIWLAKIIIDTIIATVQSHQPGTVVDWSRLFLPVGALVSVLIVSEVGRRVAQAAEDMLRFQVGHHANYLLLQKAAALDIAFYESPEFFDRLQKAQQELYRSLNLAKLITDSGGQFLSLIVTLDWWHKSIPWPLS